MKFLLNSLFIIVLCYGCTGLNVPVDQILPFLLIENNQSIEQKFSDHTLASLKIPEDVSSEKLNVIYFCVEDNKVIHLNEQETFASVEPLIHSKVK